MTDALRTPWARVAGLAAISILILVGILLASGVSPAAAGHRLLDSAFGNPMKISSTLRETTPLLIAGLAVFIALKAGLFNIGVEGQFAIGALCTAVVAIEIPGPAGILAGIAAGMAGGALWALPAGWIKAYRGGHEVITTIMLHNIASIATHALVAGRLRDPAQEGTTTRNIAEGTHLPLLIDAGKWQVSLALPLAIVLTGAFAIWLRRTVAGYELRAAGDNPRAAEFAGISVKGVVFRSMLASGAVAGFGGAMQVLAFEHRFFHGISSGYGFDALGVALLSGSNPVGMLASSLLFGVLNKGSSAIQILGIPKGITSIVLGLLILVFASIRYRKEVQP